MSSTSIGKERAACLQANSSLLLLVVSMEAAAAAVSAEPKHEDQHSVAEVNIWKMIYGLYDSLAIRFAVEVGIPDIIHAHGAPITLSDLAAHISNNNVIPFIHTNGDNHQTNDSVDLDSLSRIMRFLVHLNLVSAAPSPGAGDGQPRYELQPAAAKLLVKGSDDSIAPVLLTMTDSIYIRVWQNLTECLAKKGEGERYATPFEKVVGKKLWDYYAGEPAKGEQFNQSMACYSHLLAPALIRECRDTFAGARSVVDVGGGTGTTLRAVAGAFPHLKCTVFDLPSVVADSPDYPNVEMVGGDMFNFIPTADVVLLKWILHDWNDEECIQILKRCKEAMDPRGGVVAIIEMVLDSNSFPNEEAYLLNFEKYIKSITDVAMMTLTGGRERTEEDWKKIIFKAGFKSYTVKHLESNMYSIIKAYPL